MKEIKVGCRGHIALVDDEDFEYLNQFNWHLLNEKKGNWYAYRWEGSERIHMHRELMNTPVDMIVDHKNDKGYDNQRKNMRNCTHSQNHQNQLSRNPKGKGVGLDKRDGTYYAYIKGSKKKRISLGRFKTAIEAAIAYNKAAIELFGEFARLNVIEEGEGIV